MPTLEIDGQQVTVEEGANLIQAADRLGIEIPHYCYHPGLSVAGNCRMCLVEIEKMPKLQIACNTRAAEGMVVRTATERVRAVRQAVLEFLLRNHPIDCPICDQAGECKLQDYYMDYDLQPSRVPLEEKVHKRKVLDIGRWIVLDQERCILCTRCIRFLDEVTHTSELGLFERGDRTAIDLFPGMRLDNPYSGNVVDICPVGALTNKDFRFRARVWYLDHTPSVCPSCATGCNIEIHHRAGEIFRFRPRENPAVNRWWMCDEGRLSYKRFQGEQRLGRAHLRRDGSLQPVSWEAALDFVAEKLREASASGKAGAAAVVSAQATNEEIYAVARLFRGALRGSPVAGLSWSPPGATGDEILRDADKNPNTRGLRALGLDAGALGAVIEAAMRGEIRALFVFRADLEPVLGAARLHALRDRIGSLVVADSHGHATAALADAVLPLATFAEMDGTYTNRSGLVQRIHAAFPPPADARAGWEVVAELGARLGDGERAASAEAVFAKLAASESPFAGMTYATIGLRGAPLRQGG